MRTPNGRIPRYPGPMCGKPLLRTNAGADRLGETKAWSGFAGVCNAAVSQRLPPCLRVRSNPHRLVCRVTRDQELWGCALAIVAQHGEGAFLVASMHIDRLDGESNLDASAVWREVLRRIAVLQSAEGAAH